MLDKIKNSIKTNIWGWSFLILFGSMGGVYFSDVKKISDGVLMIWILGGLLFFYGSSIQKQITWKNAIVVGIKVFSWIYSAPLLLFVIVDWTWKIFIWFGIYIVISTFVFTVIVCVLNLIIGRKCQFEDKESEQKFVVNNKNEFNSARVWSWSAFINFVLVSWLLIMLKLLS